MFSEKPVTSVSVDIDGEPIGDATHIQEALYTVFWTPSSYESGIHVMRVTVKVIEGFVVCTKCGVLLSYCAILSCFIVGFR